MAFIWLNLITVARLFSVIMREEFPVLKKTVYLNTAGYGLVPQRAIKKVVSTAQRLLEEGPWNSSFEEKVLDEARREAAKIIGAEAEEVFFTTSTTTGLSKVIAMVGFKKGDNVVSFDLEFPGVASVVKTYCSKVGCEVRIVRHRNGFYAVEDIEKAVDEKTKAIVASSVQWVNGLVMPLKEMREIADRVSAYLILDSIQHIGAVKFNVNEIKPDFAVAGGEKWLLSTWFGVGLVYVRKELLSELESPPYGLHNMEEPAETWSQYWFNPDKDCWKLLELKKTAARFEWAGTPPILGVLGFTESLKLLNEIGISKIHYHNLSLKEKLIDIIIELNGEIVTFTENKENWSSITTFKLRNISLKEHYNIVAELKKRNIIVAARGAGGLGGIRVSPHLYNTVDDLEKLFEVIKELIK